MSQLSLFTPAQCAAVALWARPARHGGGLVLAVPFPLPIGFAASLRSAGLAPAGAESLNPAGSVVAVHLVGPPAVIRSILAEVPLPPSHGSRTPGNLLPW